MEAVAMMTDIEQLAWAGLVSRGIANSITGLSQMVGQEIVPISLNPKVVEINEVPDMVGGAEALKVGVYLQITGTATGHMVLVYEPQSAYELLDMLMGMEPGTTTEIGELERSALGEMGNITGSFFLNALSETTGFCLMPSPPAVIMDMAGAILNVALAEIMMEMDEVCLVEASFGTSDKQVNGTFLVMPSLNLITMLRKIWGS